MVYRSSFSQHNIFEKCKMKWYIEKILKIYIPSDMSYANAGKLIHTCLEKYYTLNITDLQQLKEFFYSEWEKILGTSFLNKSKDDYWIMILNGVNLKRENLNCEYKIYFDDVLAYLDCIDFANDEILDWKSSKRTSETDHEYRIQGTLYAWLYYRKYNKLPKKVIFYYLRGMNNKLELTPTIEDVEKIKEWYYNILAQMEEIERTKKLPATCIDEGRMCDNYCNLSLQCSNLKDNKIFYTLNYIGNYIYIEGEIHPVLSKQLHRKFSYELQNAHWIKKNNPMANTVVDFWKESRRILPMGFIHGLKKTLNDWAEYNKKELVLAEKDKRVFSEEKIVMPEKFINGKVLRDYQLEAADTFIKNKYGVLEIATGGGKTEVAIECIRRLGHKTLIVVERKELLTQTKERIEKALGIEVGVIGMGEVNTKHITICTIQTLNKKLKQLKEYLRTIRLTVFDECHHSSAKTYVKLNHYLTNCEHKLGLTGTSFRDDGNEMMIYSVTGEKIFKLTSKELIEKGYLTEPQVIFLRNNTPEEEAKKMCESSKEGLINETVNYQKYYSNIIVNNPYRNAKIKELCEQYKDKKILMLTKSVEHGKVLAETVGGVHLYGETNKDKRKQMLKDYIDGKYNILVSTVSIFSEGIDLPFLEILINASGNAGQVKTLQMLGRILRLFKNKNPIYFDFIDSEHRLFKAASYKRKNILQSQGYNVDTI